MGRGELRILIIDDSAADARLLQAHLEQIGLASVECTHVRTAEDGLKRLADEDFDCVLLDYRLGGVNGLDVLDQIRQAGHDIAIVLASGNGDERIAVTAIQRGAQDYLVKGRLTPAAVELAVWNAMDRVALTRELRDQQHEMRDFAHAAAHDLQAPLRRIVSYSQLVVDDAPDSLSEETRRWLEVIGSSAQQMSNLLQSLLEFARIGRSQIELQPVPLSEIVSEATGLLETDLREQSAEVRVDTLPTVLGHRVTLTQLFQNLISNALKFRGDSHPLVEISAEEDDSGWVVSVHDHGIGIDASQFDRIFKPFQRLHSTAEIEGSGIGLATCRRIVEQHGGRIWVESSPEKGATFSFCLKAVEPGEPSNPIVSDGDRQGNAAFA